MPERLHDSYKYVPGCVDISKGVDETNLFSRGRRDALQITANCPAKIHAG